MVVGATLGCADTTKAPEAGPPVPIDALVSELVGALCDGLARCTPTLQEDALLALMLGSSEECRLRLSAVFVTGTSSTGDDLADLARAVRNGTVRYDPAGARICLDRIASRCTLHALESELCFEAYSGTRPIGGSCWRSEECSGDAWCDHGPTSPRRCPGACRAKTPLGAQCVADVECTRVGVLGMARCASDSAGMRCVDERVGPAIALGQPCTDFAPSTDPRVHVRLVCAPGLLCTISDPSMSPRCVALTAFVPPVRGRVGEVCDEHGAAGMCNVFNRLRCVAGRCQPYGDGTRGSSCSTDDLPACRSGLYCDRASRTCAPVAAAFGMCSRGIGCLSGQCEVGFCLPRQCR